MNRKYFMHLLFAQILMLATVSNATSQTYNVLIKTSKGDITLSLYDKTPLHRDNFIKLANEGFFDGVLFHRVIDNFMIQSGDPDSRAKEAAKLYGEGGPGYDIPAEIVPELFHKKGALAAARENDDVNPKRLSSGSQFYIVKGKRFTDDELDSIEARVNRRNRENNIDSEYKISTERRAVYKSIGGAPHLDTHYTVFGEILSGQDIVDEISSVGTDKNDRPLDDIVILSIKIKKNDKCNKCESCNGCN